jgi:hypothetical protein
MRADSGGVSGGKPPGRIERETMLTGKQRSYLKGLAHDLTPLVYIGFVPTILAAIF